MNLIERISSCKKISLDTSVFIYHFEENPRYLKLTQQILNFIASQKINAFCSELIILEILVQPYKKEGNDLIDRYEILLSNFPHLTILPVDRSVLRKAAELRARYHIKSPDAIHLASAINSESEIFIGNDRNLSKVDDVDVIFLDEYL
ncbi:MAG: type II toxin-antitoxin system VapC family toxin [bacterium]